MELEEISKRPLPDSILISGFSSMAIDATSGLLASERTREYAACSRDYATELMDFCAANEGLRVSLYAYFSWLTSSFLLFQVVNVYK
jgi:hypothetical protein